MTGGQADGIANGRAFDVVVLGGGPAGSAAAIALSNQGHAVAMIERSHYRERRVGEVLPPASAHRLASLGLPADRVSGLSLISPGIISAWSTDAPSFVDFIFDPYGAGRHLDRPAFDEFLASHARACGVTVACGARARECLRVPNGGWRLSIDSVGGPRDVLSRFVVDATGRTAWFARRRGARRVVTDRLVGVSAELEGPPPAEADHCLRVEAVEDGWWYAAALPRGRVVATYMTDADQLPRQPRDLRAYWGERLRGTQLARALSGCHRRISDCRVVAASSTRLDLAHGDGWAAIGDAASTQDPLAARGVCRAMDAGARIAEAVHVSLRAGDDGALLDYARSVEHDYARFLAERAHYYAQVTRWPGSPFWRRRQRRPMEGASPVRR